MRWILTRTRLPVIREHVEPKTLIYTHLIQGIDRVLREALEKDGWKVGFCTGEDKSGLDAFVHGDLDEDVWKFTHIHAVKTERQPAKDIELRL